MKPSKACLQCRAGKRRCDRSSTATGRCTQCAHRDLPCSAAHRDSYPRLTTNVKPLAQSLLPASSQDELHLVDLYFQFIHNQPHSLFHESTFKRNVINGTVSKPLLLSMMGMSARFSPDPTVQARGILYRLQAKDALKAVLELVNIENLQTCILVGNNCMGDCDPQAESLYLLLATRMAQLLDLSVINEADDGITYEMKIRTYWTCIIIDTWVSGGSNVSRHLRWPTRPPRLPMDESVFASLMPGEPVVTDSQWTCGLWGHMVGLVQIYAQVQDLHKELVDAPHWDESVMEEAVQRLEAQFLAFEQSLGPGLSFSIENLSSFISRGLGSIFIAFHLGYHHYYTLLFYQYLDQRRPTTKNGREYARKCKTHASITCDVLKASREISGAEALYNIVGHVTIVSSSVLLHTYLFGEPQDLDESKQRLESNLASLVQLRNYWSSIEMMVMSTRGWDFKFFPGSLTANCVMQINRLVVFQKHCINSMNRDTHRFDKWMVKFLMAHAVELEDKVDNDFTCSIAKDNFAVNTQLERGRVTHDLMKKIQYYE